MSIFRKFHHANLEEKWRLPLNSMGNFVIFGVWLLINGIVNVTETFADILKYYFLQTNVVKFAKCML